MSVAVSIAFASGPKDIMTAELQHYYGADDFTSAKVMGCLSFLSSLSRYLLRTEQELIVIVVASDDRLFERLPLYHEC